MKFHLMFAPERAGLLVLEPHVERMGVVAVDVDLGEHRERDAVVLLAERADLLLGAGLLVAELVAREAEHHQPLVGVVVVQLLQALVLRRQAALAGGVDHEDDVADVGAEVLVLTVERGGVEIPETESCFCSSDGGGDGLGDVGVEDARDDEVGVELVVLDDVGDRVGGLEQHVDA